MSILVVAVASLVVAGTAAGRTPWTTGRVAGSPHPPSPYSVQRAFPQIQFTNPVDVAYLPGTDRLLLAEQGGKLWSFDTRRPEAKPELAIDLRRHHQPFDNVLAFAFHPGFLTNRFLFINYNEPGGRDGGAFVSRFRMSTADPPKIEPGSETVVIRWLSGGHNGCSLVFGNDGFLYISTGDADAPDPPDATHKTGQDLRDLMSSILRIDVDRSSGTNAYKVPADNPFLQFPGARPEIWAFGLRNPWRMSVDPRTGDLWVGDVGWEQWEMVYRVRRGGNYGWAITEGPNVRVRADVRPGPGPILAPLHAISHADAASITGGHVYHGNQFPALRDAYVYGDWETGRFWALRHDGDRLISNDELCDTPLKPISFAIDPQNELLILDYNGGLYRLVPNTARPANASFPRQLSQAGLFASLQPMVPAPGTLPYRINAPMWNDHATAEWLLGVPGDNAIATSGGVGNIAGATWFFPSNTVLARTLTLELERGRPASRRRIETQVLHWDGQAWNPYSYRWNAAQTDAALVDASGTNDHFTVLDPSAPGGRRETTWRFHSRAECLRCHNTWAGEALTLSWLQLGGAGNVRASASGAPSDGPTAASEWKRLEAAGVLRAGQPPQNSDPRPRPLVNPYDVSLPTVDRARSWLEVNCSICHRFNAGTGVAICLNADKAPKELRAVNEKPTRGDFGLAGASILTPGDPYSSTLFYRVRTEGYGHMPPVGPRLVDEIGIALVRDWIHSLASQPSSPAHTNRAQRLEAQASAAIEHGTFSEPLSSMNGALALVDRLASQPATQHPPAALNAAVSHTNALVRDLFQHLLPPQQRRQTLGTDVDPRRILALQGSASRGRDLFLGPSQCASCHVCGGEGRSYGPDLSGVGGKFNRGQLLEHILSPSQSIAPEFKLWTFTLRNGAEVNGFVLARTPAEVVVRDEALAEQHLKSTDIMESRESTLSAMPEGLLAPLTPQEAADLIEYLMRSQPSGTAK